MRFILIFCFFVNLSVVELVAQQELVDRLISNVNQITREEPIAREFLMFQNLTVSKSSSSQLDLLPSEIDFEISKLIDNQKVDGSWSDINYGDLSHSKWDPFKHAQRFKALTQAYKRSSSKYFNSKELALALHKAMNFWFERKLVCPNWWYNHIGVPMWMGPGFLLVKDELSATEMVGAQFVMKQKVYKATGQNKVWEGGNMALYGLLTNNLNVVKVAQDSISSEIFITTKEGLQPDFSYHQHGALMQMGNYGLSYLTSMAFWIRSFAGTPLAIDEAKTKILLDYVTYGLSWTFWRGNMDVAACGRQVIPNAQKIKFNNAYGGVLNLIAVDPKHEDVMTRFINENFKNPTSNNTLIGHSYFWRSEYAIHRTPKWFASVRMNSARTKGIEMTNKENLLGHYAADGVMSIMLSGNEYENIFPIWNWRRLPGLTAQDSVNATIDYSNRRSEFVGGVSDTKRGVEANVVIHDGLTAYKSYFFFDDQIICLGSGIKTDRNVPVFTTLDQSLSDTKVSYFSSKSKKFKTLKFENKINSDNIEGVYHNKIGYLLLSPSKTLISNQTIKGNWANIAMAYVNKPDSGKVFQFTIEHGRKPQSADYAYAIWPNVSKTAFLANSKKNTAKILINTKLCQAVSDITNTKLGAVFYNAGQLQWEGLQIKSENAGLIMIDKLNDGKYKIVVADPTKKLSKFTFSISGKCSNQAGTYDEANNQTIFVIPLPTDNTLAGSSISVNI